MNKYLLKRENIRAKPHALAFIALDGFGNILNTDSTGNRYFSEDIFVDGDETVVGAGDGGPLTILEAQVNGEVVPQPYRLNRSLSGGFLRGS